MADQSDVPAWVAGIAAFGTLLGGAVAAVFKLRPGEAASGVAMREVEDVKSRLSVLAEQVRSLEDQLQRERAETRDTLKLIFDELKAQASDIRVCRAILDERKKQL